jgi:hypothetical protein
MSLFLGYLSVKPNRVSRTSHRKNAEPTLKRPLYSLSSCNPQAHVPRTSAPRFFLSQPQPTIMDLCYKPTVSGNDIWTFVSPQEVYQVTVRSETASYMRPVLKFDLRVFYLFARSDLRTITLPVVCIIPPLSSYSCLLRRVMPSFLISQPPIQARWFVICCHIDEFAPSPIPFLESKAEH